MFDYLKEGKTVEIAQQLPAEDFTPIQMSAAEIARTHLLSPPEKRGFDLPSRLEENKKFLFAAYKSLTDAARATPLTPSAEWLVDNFHIVEEQLREARQDLPRKFYRELPKLENGALAGFPRIYRLAFEIVSQTDNGLEPNILKTFLDAFQKITPLTIGEIWAFPISLRLVLIENLRRLQTNRKSRLPITRNEIARK